MLIPWRVNPYFWIRYPLTTISAPGARLLAFSTEPLERTWKWCVDNECHATVESTWTTGRGSNLEEAIPGGVKKVMTHIWGGMKTLIFHGFWGPKVVNNLHL